MAEKTMTEVEALTNAIKVLNVTHCANFEFDGGTTIAKLRHMVEVRSRKHERKVDTSKRDANIALGKKFEELWDGEEFRIADVRDLLNVNTARAAAIARAMEWTKVPTTESVNVYTLG